MDIRNWFKKDEPVEERNIYGGNMTLSSILGTGTAITEDKLLKIPTAKACLNIITGAIAPLPVYLYQEKEDGSIERIKRDYREFLLNSENQSGKSANDFKKLLVKDILLHGMSLSYMKRAEVDSEDIGGMIERIERLSELVYLPMRNFTSTELFGDGIGYSHAKYIHSNEFGERKYHSDQLLKVLSDNPQNDFQSNGLLVSGEKIFQQALNEMEYTHNIYDRGALPLGILKTSGRLAQTAVDRLREAWNALYTGSKNSAKTVILEEGMDYKPLSMNPSDLQLNESKSGTNSEICKLFGVPESMISTASNKYGSIEQNALHFLKHTISPILHSMESAFDMQLLTEQEKKEGYFFRFDTSELLRATEKEKIEAVALGLEKGILTINEGRAKLDLPGIDDDVFMWGLQSVLYNPKTNKLRVPNMGMTDEESPKGENINNDN